MDAAPPPDLRPHSAFYERARDYAERQVFWDLFSVFTLDDRAALRTQAQARRAACLQQLQTTGRCEQFNFKSAKGDTFIDVQVDRGCVLIEIRGAAQKKLEVGLPGDIAQLLPKPSAALPPLKCKPASSPSAPDYGNQPAAYGPVRYEFG